MFKTTLLLATLTGLFLAVGYFLGGRAGAVTALIFATLTNFGLYWFSSSLVLKMQKATPLDLSQYGYIERNVRQLCLEQNLPTPKLYFVDTPIPNAFATGRSYKHSVVAVTRGITELLNEQELRAVLAHELGHIKNRDMLVSAIAATVAGAISVLAELAFWGTALFGGNNEENENTGANIAMIILAPMAALIIQMAVSRSREYGADAYGKELLGSGEELANALEKLESFKPHLKNYKPHPKEEATAHLMFTNLFHSQGLARLFSSHPPTEERVKRLRS